MIVKDLSNNFHPYPKSGGKNVIKDVKSDTKNVIKKKSSKLAKLENNRFSILTDDLTKCYLCKNKKQDLHEIFGGKNRQASMRYGLVIPVCRQCHTGIDKDIQLMLDLHQLGQRAFESKYKEDFIKVFGQNYL